MEKTARGLVKLLEAQDPNLRLAAMRVAAALDMHQKPFIEALAANLDEEAEALQVQALRAMAQLGSTDAVHLVAPKILETGAVRQHAAQVLVMSGRLALPALRRLYAKADYHGRRVIAATMGEIGGRSAFQFLLKAMPEEDLEMIKHLTQDLRRVIGKLSPASRRTALRDLQTFLKRKVTRSNPHAVIAALILLGSVSDTKAVAEAEKMLFGYLDRKHPEGVRRNAAISLSRLPVNKKKQDALALKLIPFLCEVDWQPIPQNLLPLLQRLELQAATVNKLIPLLRTSPHGSVRIHILSRLQGQDRIDRVKAILPHLSSGHPRLREAAEAALKTLPSAIGPLFQLLLEQPDGEVQRRITWIFRSHPQKVRRKYASKATDHLLKLYEKQDEVYRIFLDFVCDADPSVLQKRVNTRLKTLKKNSSRTRFDKMLAILQLLEERKLQTPEQRYEYALLLLRKSKKDVRRELRAADPALHVLSNLARDDGTKLVRNLTKEKTLGADDYYYVGFHWSESSTDLLVCARSLLEHVVTRYPRHKLRRAAKRKVDLLRSRAAAHVEG